MVFPPELPFFRALVCLAFRAFVCLATVLVVSAEMNGHNISPWPDGGEQEPALNDLFSYERNKRQSGYIPFLFLALPYLFQYIY